MLMNMASIQMLKLMHLKDNDHNLYINYDRFISNILIKKEQ
jgi:hypothetical protein